MKIIARAQRVLYVNLWAYWESLSSITHIFWPAAKPRRLFLAYNQLELTKHKKGVESRLYQPKWRNRQTRYVQGVVPFTGVWVRLPPSALELLPKKPGAFYFREQNTPLQAAVLSARYIQRGIGWIMAVLFPYLIIDHIFFACRHFHDAVR